MDDHTPETPLKRCKKCGSLKPLMEFGKDITRDDGHFPWCKDCAYLSKYKRPRPFRKPREVYPVGFKRCLSCQELLPIERFSKTTKSKDGHRAHCKHCASVLAGSTPHFKPPKGTLRCSDCKECYPATIEFFYSNKAAKSGLTHECKTCLRARVTGWRNKNLEQVRTKDRQNYVKHPRQKHPEKQRAGKLRRRARERSPPNAFTDQDWIKALKYWHNRCAYCGNPPGLLNFAKITADHWIPVTDTRFDNPGTIPANVLPACFSCNSGKCDKEPIKWLNEKFGTRKAKQILARIDAYFEWLRSQDDH